VKYIVKSVPSEQFVHHGWVTDVPPIQGHPVWHVVDGAAGHVIEDHHPMAGPHQLLSDV
jgi:hypothetical protein